MIDTLVEKLKTAVGGVGRTMLNFNPHSIPLLKTTDISPIKRGLEVVELCSELSLKDRIIGSEAVIRECRNHEDTRDWRFMGSFQEALSAMN